MPPTTIIQAPPPQQQPPPPANRPTTTTTATGPATQTTNAANSNLRGDISGVAVALGVFGVLLA